jgi:hypothetical protein
VAGFFMPPNQNDWLGIRMFIPFIIALAAGSVIAVGCTIISFARREPNAGWSLLIAVPAVFFLNYLIVGFQRGKEIRRQSVASTVAANERTMGEIREANRWTEELRAHPEWITSDEFWRSHGEKARIAELGLRWLLQDNSFSPTPEIRRYILRHLPDSRHSVFSRNEESTKELESIVADRAANHTLRANALEFLVRDPRYMPPLSLKETIIADLPMWFDAYLQRKSFTKSELEELMRRTDLLPRVLGSINWHLSRGVYRVENPKPPAKTDAGERQSTPKR